MVTSVGTRPAISQTMSSGKRTKAGRHAQAAQAITRSKRATIICRPPQINVLFLFSHDLTSRATGIFTFCS
jgi:hypothetical protein